jgi:hypothetical protein
MPARHFQERRRLTAEQFREGLKGAGLKPDGLAFLLGNRSDRVLKWARGEEDVPLWMDTYLAMLALPGARDLVLRVVRRHVSDEEAAELERFWPSRV